MTEELLPDNAEEDNKDNQQSESGEHRHGRRRRIRKRIRIKKKANPKKKIKKFAEKIIWLVIILGFIATLVIMVRQLNLVDEKLKKGKTSSMNSVELLNCSIVKLLKKPNPKTASSNSIVSNLTIEQFSIRAI